VLGLSPSAESQQAVVDLEHTFFVPEAEGLQLYSQPQKSFSVAGLHMNLQSSTAVQSLVPDGAVPLANAGIVSLDLVWSLGMDLEKDWPLPVPVQW
jgi:hypothetical protein